MGTQILASKRTKAQGTGIGIELHMREQCSRWKVHKVASGQLATLGSGASFPCPEALTRPGILPYYVLAFIEDLAS